MLITIRKELAALEATIVPRIEQERLSKVLILFSGMLSQIVGRTTRAFIDIHIKQAEYQRKLGQAIVDSLADKTIIADLKAKLEEANKWWDAEHPPEEGYNQTRPWVAVKEKTKVTIH